LDSGIREISGNQFVDEFGYVHVLWEIQNSLATIIDFVKVNVAYYDSQNKIIGADSVYNDPYTLFPGQTATYQVLTGPNSLASSDVSSINTHYEYQVNGINHQSAGSQNRIISSNAGQSFGLQNDMLSNDNAIGAGDEGCGEVVSGNFALTRSLRCNMDGLIVGGDNIIINLNGYSITGSGNNSEKVGIAIPHANNVVIQGNGSIHNFQAGALITGSVNTVINKITFEGNKISVFMTGSIGAAIDQNYIGPNAVGVASHSSNGAHTHANMMTGNNLARITLVNTNNSKIDANSIGGSRNVIFLDPQSSNNAVSHNNVVKNDIDINNADRLPFNYTGITLLQNNCAVSNPGEACNAQP
jgi:hypothetical protein